MKRAGLFFFLLFSLPVFSQKGVLEISLYRTEFGCDDSVYCSITDSADVLVYQKGFSCNELLTWDSVDRGRYTISLYVNDKLNSVTPGVKVKRGKITSVTVTATKQDFRSLYPEPDTTSGDEPEQTSITETQLFLQYGPPMQLTDTSTALNDSYKLGFSQGSFYIPAKHYAIGIFFGSDIGMTRFSKGRSMDTIVHDRERYFYWNGTLALINRFTFFNYHDEESGGILVDIGAQYSLPFLFRHVAADGNRKQADHWIHQYTNVEGIVRLGYTYCTLEARYRIFDFIQGRYPEIPPLSVGLTFLIPSD